MKKKRNKQITSSPVFYAMATGKYPNRVVEDKRKRKPKHKKNYVNDYCNDSCKDDRWLFYYKKSIYICCNPWYNKYRI